MRIVPVACLKDNYAYLVISDDGGRAAVVDPSEAAPVRAAAEREGATLVAIWNTHHHYDHVGGNLELVAALPGLEVVAHTSDQGRVPGQTRAVEEGDTVELAGGLAASILHNPGHTSGAISYHLREQAALFTGDTLFCSGCGRLFEGTPAQMHASLSKLAALPPETAVYCGHEYTAANLRFAAAVEPDNADIAARARDVADLRAAGKPSVPSTMAQELATNPFLRAAVPEVARAAKAEAPVEVFAALRRWKDGF